MRFFLASKSGSLDCFQVLSLETTRSPGGAGPEALVADVVDHPSATKKSASLANDHVEKGRSWSTGRDSATCLIWRRWARVKMGGRPPA
jgi:hypothetical protein